MSAPTPDSPTLSCLSLVLAIVTLLAFVYAVVTGVYWGWHQEWARATFWVACGILLYAVQPR